MPSIYIDRRCCAAEDGGPAGEWLTLAGWLIQALSWAFATLFVAGFTGIVRRR